MKLIDAIYVNYGGTLELLKYLVERLAERNEASFLLADAMYKGEFDRLQHV